MSKDVGNCANRFSKLRGCYKWHGDNGICENYQRKDREFKLEEVKGEIFKLEKIGE